MPAKPNSRNWNDVQTAIATAAIVSTLGLWNMFATPSKTEIVKASVPVLPPPTEPPVEAAVIPTAMPQVKIMFTTPVTSQSTVLQGQNNNQQQQKKKNDNNDNGGGGVVSVTQTSTS